MSMKKQVPTSDAAPAKPAKSKPAKQSKEKMSALDAAAKVLDEMRAPITSGELIEAMAKKGYWSSPNGQTPAATLYAAMTREISKKGKTSRFAKAERGKFARTKTR
jgi:hypothetical protein